MGNTIQWFHARIQQQKGFTLIELMATLVILAIIVAIAIPAVGNITEKSKSSADKSSISLMERAGEMADLDGLAFDTPAAIPGGETDSYLIGTLIDGGYLKLERDSKFNNGTNYVKKVNKSGKFVFNGTGVGSGGGNTDSKYRPFVTENINNGYVAMKAKYPTNFDFADDMGYGWQEGYGDAACERWHNITDETVEWHRQDDCSNQYAGIYAAGYTIYEDRLNAGDFGANPTDAVMIQAIIEEVIKQMDINNDYLRPYNPF